MLQVNTIFPFKRFHRYLPFIGNIFNITQTSNLYSVMLIRSISHTLTKCKHTNNDTILCEDLSVILILVNNYVCNNQIW